MKLIAQLIITACLILGAVAGTTAYLPLLSLDDSAFVGRDGQPLVLRADAGAELQINADGSANPLAKAGDVLTPELLAMLRAGGVERVRVKEFSFSRWSHKWYFLLACVGLFAGAFMVKRVQKSLALAAIEAGAKAGSVVVSPEAALETIINIVDKLNSQLSLMKPAEACHAIVESLDPVQKEHALVIVEARSLLITKLGMGRFAQFMDRFSAGERQLNRAWSAAADGEVYLHEAIRCLKKSAEHLAEARAKLG